MTPERPRPIPSDEPIGTEDRQKPRAETPHLFSAANIRELFGKVAEAVTGKPAPSYSAARRKRTEETRGGFRMARAIICRIHRPPPLPERPWLSDSLDWLQQWAAFEGAHADPEPMRPDSFPEDGGFSPAL